MNHFSHIDDTGKAKMVDVSHKEPLKRTAIATGFIQMAAATVSQIKDNLIAKGDVVAVAKIAGISAAKNTSALIPLCHNIFIDCVDVKCSLEAEGVRVTSQAVCVQKTGIEMEALMAVSVACLCIYDMCKAVDKSMCIGEIRLVEKRKETF
jgi:cyclic pyranopterin phosphate synthase